MLIDSEIKQLIQDIEAAAGKGPAAQDPLLEQLVGKLAQACARPENRAFYAADPARKSVIEPYPTDAQGYAVSFDPIEDEAGFRAAWERYGVVVGKSILSPVQCAEAITGIRRQFNELSNHTSFLTIPETWKNMPKDENGTPVLSRGFLEIYHGDTLAKMRQNVRAYVHNVLIWGRHDLWTTFDRVGVKLPHHEESKALPLHVDQNPQVHPGFKTVQGVLALSDCSLPRGTFVAVPGSRGVFAEYASMAKNKGEYVELDIGEEIARTLAHHAQPLPLRQGDMVSWDSRTTHGNTDNISHDTRMVFYTAAGPAREDSPEAVQARKDALTSGMGSNVREALMHASKKPRYTNPEGIARIREPEKLTILGRLLYGTESYSKIQPA